MRTVFEDFSALW